MLHNPEGKERRQEAGAREKTGTTKLEVSKRPDLPASTGTYASTAFFLPLLQSLGSSITTRCSMSRGGAGVDCAFSKSLSRFGGSPRLGSASAATKGGIRGSTKVGREAKGRETATGGFAWSSADVVVVREEDSTSSVGEGV
jgi:hypothetical protein